jgi:hypothetical protein
MLSNLRIDSGCWNHMLVPEALRLRDPYIRIRNAEVGEVRGAGVLEETIEARLWSGRELWLARTRWCEAGAGPINVQGITEAGAFNIDDLCTDWPFPPVRWPGFRAFQSNLAPECPQACIH